MNELNVRTVENGFVVYEGVLGDGSKGKTWAFETAHSMSSFVLKWGDSQRGKKWTVKPGEVIEVRKGQHV